ncbi:MAG: TIGR01458 family HAD-type hydrolase [Methanomicrobiales archaeon HGW-Methanomicrobiales-4]|nr:MAG: TIGR01458 family HAD-type hydrolase [Methanomicrobiales archaeon HGW-Methanomicrobiales-4]
MNIRAVLLDIDGTLFTGQEPIFGAANTIRFFQDNNIPYRFLSNGTRKAREAVCKKLRHLNVPIFEEQIFTPAIAAVRYLKEQGFEACTLLATDDLREDFISGDISLRDDAPVIVIGDAADHFTYLTMNSAFRQIMNGARLIALEKDQYWRDTDGLSLGAGAFIAGLEYASGVSPVLMGKPSPDFFRMALQSIGAKPASTLMVGDDIMTDTLGAMSSGLIGALVMTGKYSQETLKAAIKRPDIIIPSIASVPDLFR